MKKLPILLALIALFALPTAAQKQSRAEREAAQAAKITELLESGSFRFVAQRATTSLQSKPNINLNGQNWVDFTPSEIRSYLPFYGNAHMPTRDARESPLSFTAKKFTMDKEVIEKKNKQFVRYVIKASPEEGVSTIDMTLEVYPNGSSNLSVSRVEYSRMFFQGRIEEVEKITEN
jgi:hypothetical protein